MTHKQVQPRSFRIAAPLGAVLAGVALLLAACSSGPAKTGPPAATPEPVELVHIHGLGYSADGQRLTIPAHFGLRTYEEGRWYQPEGPEHDYMGYAAVDDGFFSSGHPEMGADLPNPLGLVHSRDDGATLESLAFLGELDFHVLGAGYKSHAVYAFNMMQSPSLPLGLHYTLDRGQSWQSAAGAGLPDDPVQIAVHPTDPAVLAVGTRAGVYASADYGETFTPLDAAAPAAAVAFTLDGLNVVYGWTTLNKMPFAGGERQSLTVPALRDRDNIMYIAVNPARPDELAVSTAYRDVFVSSDAGATWQQIAAQGQGQ